MGKLAWIAATLAVLQPVLAIFVSPQPIPASRLVAAYEARIGEAPGDADLHCALARVHYLAFVNSSSLVPGFVQTSGPGEVAPRSREGGFVDTLRYHEADRRVREFLGLESAPMSVPQDLQEEYLKRRRSTLRDLEDSAWLPPPIPADERTAHAKLAFAAFDRALALVPQHGLALLGRASLAEQVLQFRQEGRMETADEDDAIPGSTWPEVAAMYLAAFDATVAGDLDLDALPLEGSLGLISYEAGHAYLRLTAPGAPAVGGAAPPTGGGEMVTALAEPHAAQRSRVSSALEELELTPSGAITPIVIASTPGARLADLVDPAASVGFDLAAEGRPACWSWIRPAAALLVWDPGRTGVVSDGRQLFGSRTFSLFHADGYAALSLLDEDRDGVLTGGELDGLALWTDHDRDGTSDPGEVVPGEVAGLDAVATRPVAGSAPLACEPGAWFADGRVVPSFDWIAEPARQP